MSIDSSRHAPAAALITHRLVRTHGQGRINLEAARYLADAGYFVHLICEEADERLLAHQSVQWHRVLTGSYPTALLRNMSFDRRAAQILRHLRGASPNLIALNNGAATLEACELNVAMFVHAAWWRSTMHPRHNRAASAGRLWTMYQALYTRYNVRAERRAFRSARTCIALADVVRHELIQDVEIEARRVVTINPGVDCGEFRPADPGESAAVRESIGAPLDCVAALFAGDIRTNRKNLDLVLRALVQLPLEVELWVAGSTSGSPYPAMAEELGVGSRVRWLGHREDMPAVMRAADLFLFPSHYEPFGLVVLEALASGLPTVVTRQTGAADAVRGEAGLVLSDGFALAEMVDRVRAWISDRKYLAAAKLAARSEALGRSWSSMGARYAELFERIGAERAAVCTR